MKNTFGQSVAVTLFGESHGQAVGAVLDGLAPGIAIDTEYIKSRMALRRSLPDISTPRFEADEVEFLSGVYNGFTTGTPIALVIKNENARSRDYEKTADLLRPGHADFTAQEKYHGFSDPRGGGHFSGRVTAALVAAGAICEFALKQKGILIGTHLSRCAGISDRGFCDVEKDIKALENAVFPVLDEKRGEEMISAIKAARADSDSVGGVLETAACGLPAGVGEPWFDTLESVISHIVFSIPAVKGIEFGKGFGLCDMRGSEANDAYEYTGGKIVTKTNNCGGILGGISNGMPLIFRTAIKPTPSISKEQATVDVSKNENAVIAVSGRHDPCVAHRARAAVDAATALALCDMLAQRYGTDFIS